MKEIIIGMLSGTVAALGMGGGTVLILLFNIFSEYDQHLIQGTNLIFFIPTSIAAIYVNIKEKKINFKVAKIIIFLGIIGAIIGAIIAQKMDTKLLKKSFGVFLAFIAIHEIYVILKMHKNKKNNNTK